MDNKPPITVLLLPGLHGTAHLFEAFRLQCPPGFEARTVSYPPDRCVGYRDLADLVRGQFPGDMPFVLLAESFSGPLGIMLAAENPAGLKALVLAASFASPPRPRLLRHLPWNAIFRLPAPAWFLRYLLTGSGPCDDLLTKIAEIVRVVKPAVLAHRVREVLHTDVERALDACRVPILYLQAIQDRLITPSAAETIRRSAPHAVIASVAAPHLVLQSAPGECWLRISLFLESLRVG